ncbi:MAG: PEP-CTERM/exosortase system-associated acyltransferase [Gammaproteobacteria bacterium]|jgi:N-acyl amino acid synthase of PEP-CTERM/exosortase system|nr:PEP-CTERM/exosortase system-associated acyltransferase [Gammaproteobacteria bacterium]
MRYPLSENFLRYFDVEFAASEAELAEVYGIRYRVYCEEFGYEPVDAFPDRMEKDDFDEASLHALIVHKSSGLGAGCVRLVSPTGKNGEHALPFEKNCADSLDTTLIESLELDRNYMCEISRLAVDGAFRRRSGEEVTRYGVIEGLDCSQQERRTFSMIAVTCFLAATALTSISGRTKVFAMMEPFLPRLLQRSGIAFRRVGEDIDYHGLRAPYFITTESAIDNMRPDLKELYNEVYLRIESGYRE